MALVPGIGAGMASGSLDGRPVPVDSWMQGLKPSTSPPPAPKPQMGSAPLFTQYSSPARGVQAYRDNIISYNSAYDILVTRFGFSGNDATDALGVEMDTILDPDIPAPETEAEPVSEPDVSSTSDGSNGSAVMEPLFENFELIGFLAIVGAVWLFAKQG